MDYSAREMSSVMSMEPSRDEIKQWLAGILERTGETPSALARRAGLATTTLTRFLSDPHAPMLGLRSIAKIAHVAGVTPLGVPAGGEPVAGPRKPEAEHFRESQADPAMQKAIAALIGARSDVEPWISRSDILEHAGVLPGDVLIVDTSASPAPGDIVRATLKDWKEAATETVFRLYEPPYLMAATLSPRRRKPLLIEHDRVQITGVVQHLVRKL
ncbi:MAG: hypothetical protein WCZ28_06115 [Burkholderiaceae bacterium]